MLYTDMSKDFPAWLQTELKRRDWTQATLARSAGLDRQLIWKYLNGRTAKPDEDVLQAIARAFKMPVEEVYRAAGILPQIPASNEWSQRIQHAVDGLPDEEKERVYIFVDSLRQNVEKKKQNNKKR